jgi:hypothetical protein
MSDSVTSIAAWKRASSMIHTEPTGDVEPKSEERRDPVVPGSSRLTEGEVPGRRFPHQRLFGREGCRPHRLPVPPSRSSVRGSPAEPEREEDDSFDRRQVELL